MLRLFVASFLLAVIWAMQAMAESAAVGIYAAQNGRIAYIETTGELYNSSVERNAGSGMLIGNRIVVTNNHLIPYAEDFRKLTIRVRLGSRKSKTLLKISDIQRDPERDLAVLKLAEAVADPSPDVCPLPLLDRESMIPIGSSLFVLGYPVDQDLSVSGGIVSNKSGPSGRWQTDVPINPGTSGGPAFGESGILVGFAVSGIVSWNHGDVVVPVQNVNFVIPTYELLQGPLAPMLEELPPPPVRCWRRASAQPPLDASNLSTVFGMSIRQASSIVCSISDAGVPVCNNRSPSIRPAPLPERFSRSYTVARVKEFAASGSAVERSKYVQDFSAEEGYQISGCAIQTSSFNNVDQLACTIGANRRVATLSFTLASGQNYQIRNGWLQATVTLVQKRQ